MNTYAPFGGGLVASLCSKAAIACSHLAKLCFASSARANASEATRKKTAVDARRIAFMANYFAANAASIAFVTSSESGFVIEPKRARIFPSRPMRNFVKFHLMLPANGEFVPASSV